MKAITGRVVKAVGGRFWVQLETAVEPYCARGKILQGNEIIIGDIVTIEDGIIESVLPRKNQLLRPQIANIEQLAVIIAPKPKPDFYLIDKLLVHCCIEKLDMILCVNKSDLSEHNAIFELATKSYEGDCVVIKTCALHGDASELTPLLKNKITCFCGQSAAGKSTLINFLAPNANEQTGELSQKILRGKHTTRHAKVFALEEGGLVADTPGFTRLSINNIFPDELNYFYSQFVAYKPHCAFNSCVHINEPSCAVKRAVENGEICKERWERYKDIFNELTKKKRY